MKHECAIELTSISSDTDRIGNPWNKRTVPGLAIRVEVNTVNGSIIHSELPIIERAIVKQLKTNPQQLNQVSKYIAIEFERNLANVRRALSDNYVQ